MRLLTAAAVLLLGVVALAMPISKQEKEACTGHMGLEVPCFDLVSKNKAYEIRKYGPGLYWSSATIPGPADWKVQTKAGFKANFGYISGDNADSMKIKMAAPVSTTRKSDGEMYVGFFLPSELDPPPAPTAGSGVSLVETSTDRYFAVITFGGWADDTSFTDKETELKEMLDKDGVEMLAGRHSWLQQYDPPFNPVFRLNEVWVPIKPVAVGA